MTWMPNVDSMSAAMSHFQTKKENVSIIFRSRYNQVCNKHDQRHEERNIDANDFYKALNPTC